MVGGDVVEESMDISDCEQDEDGDFVFMSSMKISILFS